MGRCADCASFPWNVNFDPTTFTAVKCDERLKARSWTPERRDAENDCPFFKNKNEPVKVPEPDPVIPEPVQEVVVAKKRGRRASNSGN